MKILVDNCIIVLWMCLNILRWTGFYMPDNLTGYKKMILPFYVCFWVIYTNGFSLSQAIALFQEWGNVTQMTNISFLLFTNLMLVPKLCNLKLKTKAIQAIIEQGDYELRNEKRVEGKKIIRDMNKETALLLFLYIVDVTITLSGWVVGTEDNQLVFRAWYPYDFSKSPAFQLTYIFQIVGVLIIAPLNVSIDQVATTSIAVCRVRLQLVGLSLRTLCEGIPVTNQLLNPEEEEIVRSRLRRCVLQHQAALKTAVQLQECFMKPLLAQFTVSTITICVSAYQLAEEKNKPILWLVSMTTYFVGMVWQVHFYCNEANKLSEESSAIAEAVYMCEWYAFSIPLRRAVLVVMVRSRKVCSLTAGGFVTLSLDTFLSIIRASYSFFTLLKQLDN